MESWEVLKTWEYIDYMATMRRNDYTYSFDNNKVTGSAISDFVNTALRWESKKNA